mgnify:CR=1 FL=1
MNKATVLLVVVSLCLLIPSRMQAALAGTFVQDGNNWTYSVPGEKTISGILHKPAGDGPFPAVVISPCCVPSARISTRGIRKETRP